MVIRINRSPHDPVIGSGGFMVTSDDARLIH